MDETKGYNKVNNHAIEVVKDLFCGSLGGLAGTIVSHPMDTIRIRLQLQDSHNKKYKGIVDCARKTIQLEGTLGLYKGILPPILFQMPTYALLFAGKELGDRVLPQIGDFTNSTKSLLAG